jgi:arylsulfatase A-like enzyme
MPPRMISARRSPNLARILSARGYATRAFTGGGFVNPDFGFDRGFDAFSNIDSLRHRDASFFKKLLEGHHSAINRMKRGGVIPFRITQELIDENGPERVHGWLREHQDEPFFLFLHTYTVHDYDPPDEYRRCKQAGCTSALGDFSELRLTRATGWTPMEIPEVDRQHLIHLYDEALRFTDHLVGEFLDQLDELGLSERTIVVITSDHGEEMFDRGFFQHGKTLYEELTAVPLLLRYPGVEPGVIEQPVMLVDLAPTLLGLLGMPADARMQGIDLLRSEPAPRPVWAEIDDAFVHKYAYRAADGTKLLYGSGDERLIFPAPNEWELYDLEQDPGEQDDLSTADVARLAHVRKSFQKQRAALKALAATLGEVGLSELDPDTLRQLQELGYVDGE